MIIDTLLEQSIYYEARAARDAAAFERQMYVGDGAANWLIVRLDPADGSGAATIAGGYIDAETGELKLPEGAETSILKSGRWERVDGTADTSGGDYHWLEPLEEGKRRLDPEDVYSPFVDGGVLLVAPDPTAQGIGQFGAPVLLFEDWVAAVPEAIGTGPQGDGAATDPPTLERLRGSGNRLISAAAWRRSLTLGMDDLQADLDAVTGEALAVRTRLLLDLGGETLARDVMQAIGAATDLDDLEAMAVGAFSAVRLPSPGSGAAAQSALRAIAARVQSLDRQGREVPKLHAILGLSGLADQ